MMNLFAGILIGLIASLVIKKGESEIQKAIPENKPQGNNHYQFTIDRLDNLIAECNAYTAEKTAELHAFNNAMRKDYTKD